MNTQMALYNTKVSKNFRAVEFANSKDGYAILLNYELVEKLQKLRDLVGGIEVTSGYRTPEYNKKIGGSKNSNHLLGHAADIVFDFTGLTVTAIKKMCEGVGFKNVGIYLRGNTFAWVHVDIGNREFDRWSEKNGWKHYKKCAFKVYSV